MTYEQQLLRILMDVGQRGISVRSLTKHLYNQNTSFFSQPDLRDIYRFVQRYVRRNSRSSQSLLESTGRRGYYRLNTSGSDYARQLMLQFRKETGEKEKDEEEEEKKPATDMSLDLFADI